MSPQDVRRARAAAPLRMQSLAIKTALGVCLDTGCRGVLRFAALDADLVGILSPDSLGRAGQMTGFALGRPYNSLRHTRRRLAISMR